MIKGIIFDLDGVIVHTDKYHYKAWKKMADEIGVPFDETDNNRLRGVSRMESLEIILEKSNRKYSEEEKVALASKKNSYYVSFLNELNPEAVDIDVRRALQKLRQNGYLMAIGSSSKNARPILERINLLDAFDFISDGTMIKNSKPDPEVFLLAANGIKLNPEDCLVVEDAIAGVEAAIRGGFIAAGIGDGREDGRVYYKLNSVADLPNILNYVIFDKLNKIYPKNVHAVVDFDLAIQRKEFIVFVGPSGCGKTTTLRMLAGLEGISSGDLFIDGEYSNEATSSERDIAMVFQSYALYPQMNVFNNIAFALKIKRIPKKEIERRVIEVAKILEIEELLARKPKELSGGQRQRVALGRAIVKNARLFLMDEPLSNLDAKLRVQMRAEIIKLHKQINATTIYVTHDQTEAMTMADRIVVMKKGVVQQIGSPAMVYSHPENMFVAGFIGAPAMNFFDGRVASENTLSIEPNISVEYPNLKDRVRDYYKHKIHTLQEARTNLLNKEIEKTEIVKTGEMETKVSAIDEEITRYKESLDKSYELVVGVRPEDIHIASIDAIKKYNTKPIRVVIDVAELLGSEYFIHFRLGNTKVIAKIPATTIYDSGDEVELVINPNRIHIFDSRTEERIN